MKNIGIYKSFARKWGVFTLVSILFILAAQGQSILDDSTELVYGPTTARHFYEEDLLLNDLEYQFVDTSLWNFENFDPVDRSGKKYQNLGNLGTALFPVFYDLPDNIGVTSGFGAYEPYNVNAQQKKYYNTKSPHIDVTAVLAAQTRSKIDFTFTQNINPNLNFGFDVRRLVADKQLGRTSQGDRNTESTLIDLFMSYNSKNKKYDLLATAKSFKHRVDETGGIVVDTVETVNLNPVGTEDSLNRFVNRADLFLYQQANIALRDAENTDFRTSLHVYHQYKLNELLQAYHVMDISRQNNGYTDSNVSSAVDVYDNAFLSESSTDFLSSFTVFQNEVGIKGSLGPAYYSAYLKRRDLNHNSYGFTEPFINPFEKFSENYLGGRIRLEVKDLGKIFGEVEALGETGDFKLKANLESKLFNASYKVLSYRPSLLQQRYFGNHYRWNNDFNSILVNELAGTMKLKIGNLVFNPSLSIKTLDRNFVYFGEDKQPVTAGESTVISHFGAKMKYVFKEKFVIENEFIYTANDNQAVVRIPQNFYNGKLYVQNTWFNKTIPVMLGFDVYGRSSYNANAYDPITQQFYAVQNGEDFTTSYVTVDAFFNARIDHVFVFFKWVHLNMPANDGYFITPYHNGQQRVIDFGVRWMFYD